MKNVSPSNTEPKRILIVGGGFGGVRVALDLAKQNLPNTRIVLVSNSHHFVYTPTLYKLATGASPLETCIPLSDIFEHTHVEVLVDTIEKGSTIEKVLVGKSGSRYQYDFLVLALGSESTYYNIPGIAENALTLKDVETTLRLKSHVHQLFASAKGLSTGSLMSQFQFVVVGGGPAGVELASVIREYTRALAIRHSIPKKFVTVDILQATPRLLPTMNEEVSRRVTQKLNMLGINIILGKPVTGEDVSGVYLKDIKLNAKTIIWTAGVRASHVYTTIEGLTLEKNGRVIVDEHLQAINTQNVFVIGDSASTPHAGTAQTANYDGAYVPRVIEAILGKTELPLYTPKQTPYVIPLGKNWAVLTYKDIVLSGWIIRVLRECIDLRFFLSILPIQKAFAVWRTGGGISESCPDCEI
jgi:NADH dehydrogenase